MSVNDIKIDLALMPAPTEWKPTIGDLVTNSTRVGSGKMRFNYVATKVTWSAKWVNLTEAEFTVLMGAIEGKSFFNIECYDPVAHAVVSKAFYKSDRAFDNLIVWSVEEKYGSVSMTFIEQ